MDSNTTDALEFGPLPNNTHVGDHVNITWSGSDGVSIPRSRMNPRCIQSNIPTSQAVELDLCPNRVNCTLMASSIEKGSYTWQPDSAGTYAFQITDEYHDSNYSNSITVQNDIPVYNDPTNEDAVYKHTIGHGAISGIVIGAVALLVFISASAILYWRRRRRSSKLVASELPYNQKNAVTQSDPNTKIQVPELDQDGAVYRRHELPHELRTLLPQSSLEQPLEATGTSTAKGRVVEMGDSA